MLSTRLLLVPLCLAGCAGHPIPAARTQQAGICVSQAAPIIDLGGRVTNTWDCAGDGAFNAIAPLVYQDQE